MSDHPMMQSWRLPEFGQPLVLHTEDPPVPVGREVLVRIAHCGICHSDLHVQDGYVMANNTDKVSFSAIGVRTPLTLGHEIMGHVAAAGPDAQGSVAVGDPCAVFPWMGCGVCETCKAGRLEDCPTPAALGLRRQGGFSNYVLVPDPRYIVPSGTLSPELVAVAGCSILTAYGALRKLPPLTSRDWIVIIGAGGVGLAAIALARHVTAARVLAVDTSDAALEAAKACGATETINAAEGSAGVLARTGGAAGVIDFVGGKQTAETALAVIARNGVIVVVGLKGGEVGLPLTRLALRSLTVRGSYTGTLKEFREVMVILEREGGLDLPLTPVAFSEVNQAMDTLRRGGYVGRAVIAVPGP